MEVQRGRQLAHSHTANMSRGQDSNPVACASPQHSGSRAAGGHP